MNSVSKTATQHFHLECHCIYPSHDYLNSLGYHSRFYFPSVDLLPLTGCGSSAHWEASQHDPVAVALEVFCLNGPAVVVQIDVTVFVAIPHGAAVRACVYVFIIVCCYSEGPYTHCRFIQAGPGVSINRVASLVKLPFGSPIWLARKCDSIPASWWRIGCGEYWDSRFLEGRRVRQI